MGAPTHAINHPLQAVREIFRPLSEPELELEEPEAADARTAEEEEEEEEDAAGGGDVSSAVDGTTVDGTAAAEPESAAAEAPGKVDEEGEKVVEGGRSEEDAVDGFDGFADGEPAVAADQEERQEEGAAQGEEGEVWLRGGDVVYVQGGYRGVDWPVESEQVAALHLRAASSLKDCVHALKRPVSR